MNMTDPDAIPPRQRFWITLLSSGLLAFILDLIRRRRLREDDAWLWLIIGLGTTFLGNQYRFLRRISHFFGIVVHTSTIFFFGHIFLILLQIQNSVRINTIHLQMKNLCQEIAVSRPENNLGHDARTSS